ncbi:MAG: Obg family GTPase [Victivallis sp.]
MADVGLVGYPNAGKSTLLRAVSAARPKVAPYPFTTLHPVVGVIEYPDYSRITMADIPGLIKGAHDNVGLGHAFLKHIERTTVLAYVLDMGGVDGRPPWDDLAHLREELELYMKGLSKRATIIVANKMDLPVAAG